MAAFSLATLIDGVSFDDALTGIRENNLILQSYRRDLLNRIDRLPVQEAPLFYHTLGFAASGKTTLLNYCLEQEKILPDGVFMLSFDRLMDEFPLYQRDYRLHGAEAAFQKWEVPARALGYELLEAALNHRAHIVFEHSGARADHVALLEQAKNALGYRVIMLETQCDPQSALDRAATRPRYLPPEYVYDRQKIIAGLRPSYLRLADEFHVYDTNTFPPQHLRQEKAA